LAEFREYLNELYRVIQDNPGRAQIMDGTNGIWLPSEIQIAQGNWIREHQDFLVANCSYTAYIIENKLTKVVLMGIFMVQKPQVPYIVVKNLEEAKEGLRKKLALLVN